MCDKPHFEELKGRVDALEDSVLVYHAKTDEQIKTLFNACRELNDSAKTLLKVFSVSLVFIVTVAVFALVYGAIGQSGFNAVTRAAGGVHAEQ